MSTRYQTLESFNVVADPSPKYRQLWSIKCGHFLRVVGHANSQCQSLLHGSERGVFTKSKNHNYCPVCAFQKIEVLGGREEGRSHGTREQDMQRGRSTALSLPWSSQACVGQGTKSTRNRENVGHLKSRQNIGYAPRKSASASTKSDSSSSIQLDSSCANKCSVGFHNTVES